MAEPSLAHITARMHACSTLRLPLPFRRDAARPPPPHTVRTHTTAMQPVMRGCLLCTPQRACAISLAMQHASCTFLQSAPFACKCHLPRSVRRAGCSAHAHALSSCFMRRLSASLRLHTSAGWLGPRPWRGRPPPMRFRRRNRRRGLAHAVPSRALRLRALMSCCSQLCSDRPPCAYFWRCAAVVCCTLVLSHSAIPCTESVTRVPRCPCSFREHSINPHRGPAIPWRALGYPLQHHRVNLGPPLADPLSFSPLLMSPSA
jgi:hypothetical protein